MPDTPHPNPTLQWEWATGYDFFISLHVLHRPDRFALRGVWAKGVRSRLPPEPRDFFERTAVHFLGALPWVHSLPAPRNGETILDAYGDLPVKARLPALMSLHEVPTPIAESLLNIAERGQWMPQDRQFIEEEMQKSAYEKYAEDLETMLNLWANAEAFGEQSLEAFNTFYHVFFAEEEARIAPALQQAAERGKELAATLALPALLEELSEGVRFDKIPPTPALTLIPSFWISPLIVMFQVSPSESIFIFGGRPADASLVPGEAVPDALYRTLKALADPTRLRILHYLEEKPRTPTELASTLRLRAPTVIHHLTQLRLAGLVYFSYGKGEKRYAARTTRISEMYLQLRRYLGDSEAQQQDHISARPPYVA